MTRLKVGGILETVNVREPKKWDNATEKYVTDYDDGKYEIRLLVDKKDNLGVRRLLNGLKTFSEENNLIDDDGNLEIPIGGKMQGRKELYNCIKDGDNEEHFEKYKDVYKGYYVVSVKNNYQPSLFDMDGNYLNSLMKKDKDMVDGILEEQFYRGATAYIQFDLYTSNNKDRKGIYGSLKSVKVIMLTEPLNDVITEFELTDEELEFFLNFDNYEIDEDDYEDIEDDYDDEQF